MTVSSKLVVLLALTTTACRVSVPAPTAKVTVAAAADLKFAMDEISRAFRESHPETDVQVAYGSSGNFFAQIQNGAPFDLFLSADIEYARKLDKPVFTYASGRLAVWVPANSRLDPKTALRDPSLARLAIANPSHAPYGRAAEAALRNMEVWDAVRSRVVLGENVAQTMQFVQSGVADAGIVALSLALAPPVRGQGRYWEIPVEDYPRLEQGGAILHDSPAARQLRDFLLSVAGRRILKEYGFLLPGE